MNGSFSKTTIKAHKKILECAKQNPENQRKDENKKGKEDSKACLYDHFSAEKALPQYLKSHVWYDCFSLKKIEKRTNIFAIPRKSISDWGRSEDFP